MMALELHDLYFSPNVMWVVKFRRTGLAGHMTNMGGEERCIQCLFGKPEGKRPLGKPRHRWEDNTGMYLKEISWKGIDWIDLAEDGDRWKAVVNMVMNLIFYRSCAVVFHTQVLFPATAQS